MLTAAEQRAVIRASEAVVRAAIRQERLRAIRDLARNQPWAPYQQAKQRLADTLKELG